MTSSLQTTVMRVRTFLLSLVVVAGTAVGMVATAAPASALPTCLGVSAYQGPGGQYFRPTTADNTRDINCVLGLGSRSRAVNYLQFSLVMCYGQQIGVDGIYGSQTAAAVRNVQRVHGIPADGVFGPVTNLKMFWWYGTSPGHCFGR
jgi:peptidoglycan hydrolase-like protein with peptidoglycan-binding domain